MLFFLLACRKSLNAIKHIQCAPELTVQCRVHCSEQLRWTFVLPEGPDTHCAQARPMIITIVACRVLWPVAFGGRLALGCWQMEQMANTRVQMRSWTARRVKNTFPDMSDL